MGLPGDAGRQVVQDQEQVQFRQCLFQSLPIGIEPEGIIFDDDQSPYPSIIYLFNDLFQGIGGGGKKGCAKSIGRGHYVKKAGPALGGLQE